MKFQPKFIYFHSRKCFWKCRLLWNVGHLVLASLWFRVASGKLAAIRVTGEDEVTWHCWRSTILNELLMWLCRIDVIYRIMCGLTWIMNFCHSWGYTASRVTKKSLFIHSFISYILFYVLNTQACQKHGSFRHFRQGRSFLTYPCDVTTVDLWYHANARYWHCDVIFVDCSWTYNLAQSWSSLVNYKH